MNMAGDGKKILQSQADELKDNRYHESSLLSLTSLINLYQEGRRQRKYNFEQTCLYCWMSNKLLNRNLDYNMQILDFKEKKIC